MKKFILFIFLSLSFISVNAQTPSFKFGYFSYSAVLAAMPEYIVAQRNLATLKAQYAAEGKRAEDEFNKKYEDFLDGQKDFAPSIRVKRQSELKDLMDKNVAFRRESERLMTQATSDAYIPVKAKLNDLVSKIGQDRGYAFIINTDNDAAPYVNSSMGEDITQYLLNANK